MKRENEKFTLHLKDKELNLIEDALEFLAKKTDKDTKAEADTLIKKLYSEAYN